MACIRWVGHAYKYLYVRRRLLVRRLGCYGETVAGKWHAGMRHAVRGLPALTSKRYNTPV
jgi:hypothetical protein